MNSDYHIHTNLTDGTLTPEQIISIANASDVKIAITEHIHRQPTYDWFTLRDTIKHLDKNVLVGVEAKVLDEAGTLDAPEDILREAELVLGSIHSIGKIEWLLNSTCDIIAHPQITQANVNLFRKCGKVLEVNSLHRLPWEMLDQLVEGNTFSFGSDTHSPLDFYKGQVYFHEVNQRYPNIKVMKEI